MDTTTGLILFGHGARDPRWREPFDRLAALVAESHPGPVSLAFLEMMSPDLQAACRSLVECGAQRVVVVPLFLAAGGHLRKDLPVMLESAREAVGVPVTAAEAIGEDSQVRAALADYCLRCVS